MIQYSSDVDTITESQLEGPFFVGWPRPPDAAGHLRILQGSQSAMVAIDGSRVVGFATALTDGVLTAFISLLEVTPDHQGRGIGSELVRRLVADLEPIYAIDAVCDRALIPYYERLGFFAMRAVSRRDYDQQPGRSG